MVFNLVKICCFVVVLKNFPGLTFGVKLGETCRSHQECETELSKCHQDLGTCVCLPYYARVNNTCLQSSLLGFECVVDEQCTLKVANSVCQNNVCECESKFWRYRSHTCLPPAKLGEVCYSDAHCTLSGEKSRCQFTIPGVFGFCVCDPPGSRVDCSMTTAGQDPAAALIRPNNSAFKYPFGKPDPKKKVPYQKRTTTTSTTTSAPSTTDTPAVKPFRPSQLQLPFKWPGLKVNATNDAASKVTTTLAATPSPVKLYLKNPLKDTQNKSQAAVAVGDKTPNKMHKKPLGGSTSGITLRKGDPKRRVSLGFPCVNDAQCVRNDGNSRCVNGVCDCQPNNKTGDQCSAKNRGCFHNTFQCRSTGKCISWFFVCDGRTGDCGEDDDSDEECSGNQQCPSTAFACRTTGNGNLCVSRSTRCDGVKNCPFGDDEEGCNASGHKGCPAYTFQCGGGQCLPEYELCNAVATCPDKSDELEGLCGGPVTVGGHKAAERPVAYASSSPPPLTRVRGAYRHGPAECPFRCRNGRCRSAAILCSGRDGCGDGSDESACSVCKCPAVS